VSYWYGQLALLPPAVRTASFRIIDKAEWLKAATLFVAARRDATACKRLPARHEPDSPFVFPLIH